MVKSPLEHLKGTNKSQNTVASTRTVQSKNIQKAIFTTDKSNQYSDTMQ
jgi:hypothetical protein